MEKKVGIIAGIMAFALCFAASASAATLTLSPSTKTVNVGDTFSVDILLDTQGQAIDGVDINALNYNPYNLQLQDADSGTAGTQIQAGTLMPNTVTNTADTSNGKIVFSQITNGGSTYTGSGKLATVTFKALVAGTANVTFDATPGVTTDSNVASKGADILSSVVNGKFTINNAPIASSGNTGTGNTGSVTNFASSATTGSSPSISSLLALLAQLQAELKALVQQAIAQGVKLPAGLAQSLGITPGGQAPSGFFRNLTVGMSGADVKLLQQFLNAHGFIIVATGPGSPGNEVIVFGLKTKTALAKFQAANGLPATGFFGALTRAKVNAAR